MTAKALADALRSRAVRAWGAVPGRDEVYDAIPAMPEGIKRGATSVMRGIVPPESREQWGGVAQALVPDPMAIMRGSGQAGQAMMAGDPLGVGAGFAGMVLGATDLVPGGRAVNVAAKASRRLDPWIHEAVGGIGEKEAAAFANARSVMPNPSSRPATNLPMDATSLEARATEMGMDIDGYHATHMWQKPPRKVTPEMAAFEKRHAADGVIPGSQLGDIREFDRNASINIIRRRPSMDAIGSWFQSNPESALNYGDHLYPVRLAIKNPWKPGSFDEFLDQMQRTAGNNPARMRIERKPMGAGDVGPLREWLKKQGYDGVEFSDGSVDGMPGKVYVTLEPNQIRSRYAVFDTRKKSSGDILASTLGALGLGAAALKGSEGRSDD